MQNFSCPNCQKKVGFLTLIRAPFPWRLKCKHCGEKLKLNRLKRTSIVLSFIFGLLLGAISIAAYSFSQIGLVGVAVFCVGLILYEYIVYLILLKLGVTLESKNHTQQTKAKKKYTKFQLLIIATLSVFALSIAYWEFIYDIEPTEALEYYSQLQLVSHEGNAAFDIAGLAAPKGIKDLHAWGEIQVAKNLERHLNGKNLIEILTDTPNQDGWLHLDLQDSDEHFECWLPKDDWEHEYKSCMDETQIRNVLETNNLLLERYKKIFVRNGYEEDIFYEVGLGKTLSLTRLLVIEYWLRKENLSDEDITTIFNFFRFWEDVSRNGNLTLITKAISIVNYGWASKLLASLTEENPSIIDRYYADHGNFLIRETDTAELDNLISSEFRNINAEMCFLTQYGDLTFHCKPIAKHLTLKPGRTINFIFDNKPKLEDCKRNNVNSNNDSSNSELESWITLFHIFKRPGNYRGRLMGTILNGSVAGWCTVFENIDIKVEHNEFRNLYLYFRENRYSSKQITNAIRENKELFRIRGKSRYFGWDETNSFLFWDDIRSDQRYRIPYL